MEGLTHTQPSSRRPGVRLRFETKHHLSFPKPHHIVFVPKLNQSVIDLLHQNKMCGAQEFACRLETLKGRLSASYIDAKGYVVYLDKITKCQYVTTWDENTLNTFYILSCF